MKYGVILYKDTDNIGDDIQTYAAARFLPKVDYVIDRERLDEFIPDKKEFVSVIANAWYMHEKNHFPFSPYINPLMISMHFTEYGSLVKRDYKFLEGYTKNYLTSICDKPIGCRDLSTKDILDKLGYKTYFSGCMTLTLQIPYKKEKKKYICVAGLNDKIVKHIKKLFSDYEVKVISHDLVSSEQRNISYEDRMKRAEDFLKVYQDASLVITNKLHCALPCLALETPVLLVYYENTADRIGTFIQYLNHCSEEEIMSYDKDYLLSLKNSKEYMKIRKKLIKTVEDFVEESKNIKINRELPDLDVYKDFVSKLEHNNDLFVESLKGKDEIIKSMADKIRKLEKDILKEQKKSNEIFDEKNRILDDFREKEKVIEELQQLVKENERMEGSRLFKLFKKYYDFRNKEEKK